MFSQIHPVAPQLPFFDIPKDPKPAATKFEREIVEISGEPDSGKTCEEQKMDVRKAGF
jgi:hypothetical protein